MSPIKWPKSPGESTYRLLSDENVSEDGSMKEQIFNEKMLEHRVGGQKYRRNYWAIIPHLVFFAFYSTLFFTLVLSSQKECADDQTQVWSPARSALKPEKVLFQNEVIDANPFRGKPRPELDAAWDDLVKYSNIRVSAEDLRRINRNSVPLADEIGGYWSGLNVHHQLHCLKMVRMAIYPDYYWGGKTTPRHLEGHIDHCVDNIRQTLMCKADISLGSYDWVDNNKRPLTNFHTVHSCYNWDLVNNWAGERSFDMYNNVTLVHPTRGKSYPVDAEGNYVFVEEPDPFTGNFITPDPRDDAGPHF